MEEEEEEGLARNPEDAVAKERPMAGTVRRWRDGYGFVAGGGVVVFCGAPSRLAERRGGAGRLHSAYCILRRMGPRRGAPLWESGSTGPLRPSSIGVCEAGRLGAPQ